MPFPESENRFDAIVVGAGIIGVAHAALLARAGRRVLVLEREQRAVGASVRNLGMIWPVGQPLGELRNLALRSRDLWQEILDDAGIWYSHCGSLHLAYAEDELAVMQEFAADVASMEEAPQVIEAEDALRLSPHIRRENLMGALYSESELSVDPRATVHKLAAYLSTEFAVQFRFGQNVTAVRSGAVETDRGTFEADEIFLCLGPTVGHLYPDLVWGRGTKLCKLQMLRARPKESSYQIGTHLCAGLTLLHYANFASCPSLPKLANRLNHEWPGQAKHHIHLLVSQHADGSLTIGDSHEYGFSFSPFSDESIDRLILQYLDTFLPTSDFEVVQRWQGYYPKHPKEAFMIERPEPGVTVVNVLTGAGMTFSFGLAELALGSKVTA